MTSAESIERVINPLLIHVGVVGFGGLTCLHNSLNELIDIVVLVKVVPDGFSVVWVIATSESLFGTVIEEGNTSGSQ